MSDSSLASGNPLRVFKPGVGNIVAGFILSFLLVAAGLTALTVITRVVYQTGGNLPMDAKKGASWLTLGLWGFIGAILLAGGIWLGTYCLGLLSHRVEFYDDGLRYRKRATSDDVRWEEIARVREIVVYARPPIVKGPARMLLPEIANTSFVIVTKTGREHPSDGNSIKFIKRFGKAVREQTDPRSVPWDVVESHV